MVTMMSDLTTIGFIHDLYLSYFHALFGINARQNSLVRPVPTTSAVDGNCNSHDSSKGFSNQILNVLVRVKSGSLLVTRWSFLAHFFKTESGRWRIAL